jgi:hypothetical protein
LYAPTFIICNEFLSDIYISFASTRVFVFTRNLDFIQKLRFD